MSRNTYWQSPQNLLYYKSSQGNHPHMIKSLLLSSVVVVSSIFGGVQSAEANGRWTCFDLRVDGTTYGEVCNDYVGTNSSGVARYKVQYTNNARSGREETDLVIDCRGSRVIDWKSYGNLSNSQNNWIANRFCESD